MAHINPSEATWIKSSYSSANSGQCVEITLSDNFVAVRDSKNPTGGVLAVTAGSWKRFVAGVGSASRSMP